LARTQTPRQSRLRPQPLEPHFNTRRPSGTAASSMQRSVRAQTSPRLSCHLCRSAQKRGEERDAGGAASSRCRARFRRDAKPRGGIGCFGPRLPSSRSWFALRAAPLTIALAPFFRSSAKPWPRSRALEVLSGHDERCTLLLSCLLCRSFGGVSSCWPAARRRSSSHQRVGRSSRTLGRQEKA